MDLSNRTAVDRIDQDVSNQSNGGLSFRRVVLNHLRYQKVSIIAGWLDIFQLGNGKGKNVCFNRCSSATNEGDNYIMGPQWRPRLVHSRTLQSLSKKQLPGVKSVMLSSLYQFKTSKITCVSYSKQSIQFRDKMTDERHMGIRWRRVWSYWKNR